MSLGRPFHTFVPATGKARPLTVDRWQVGMSSRSVKADLSLCRCLMSATHVNDDAKYGGAEPCSAWYISITTLNIIRSGTNEAVLTLFKLYDDGCVLGLCIVRSLPGALSNDHLSSRSQPSLLLHSVVGLRWFVDTTNGKTLCFFCHSGIET